MLIETPTLERIHPDWLKPKNIFKIWRGETDIYPLTPLGVYFIFSEHRERYNFASQFTDGNVVDAACGTGYGGKILKNYNDSITYFGLDISNSAITQSQQIIGSHGNILQADISIGLPFGKNSITSVVSFETIEHLEENELKIFMKEVTRILIYHGRFIVSTPNRSVFGSKRSDGDKPTNNYHKREYTFSEFKQILETYFQKVDYYSQGLVNSDEVTNPSSFTSRMNRVLGMLTNRQIKISSMDSYLSNTTPRYFVAVCEKF